MVSLLVLRISVCTNRCLSVPVRRKCQILSTASIGLCLRSMHRPCMPRHASPVDNLALSTQNCVFAISIRQNIENCQLLNLDALLKILLGLVGSLWNRATTDKSPARAGSS